LEDDAFWNLDNKYGTADLLCRSNFFKLWHTANNKYDLPAEYQINY